MYTGIKSILRMCGLLLLIMVFGSIGGGIGDMLLGSAAKDVRAGEFRLVDRDGKTRGILIIPGGTGDNAALLLSDENGRPQALYSSSGLMLYDHGKMRAGFVLNKDGGAVIRFFDENGAVKKEFDFID